MYRWGLAVLVGVLAIFAVGAGCGGSDEVALTKAEFVKQSNAICKKGTQEAVKQYGALMKKASKAKEGTAAAAAADPTELGEEVLLPLYRAQAEELAALTPPSADEEEVAEIIAAIEEGVEEGEEKPEQVSQAPAILRSSKLAGEYGLEECDRY